MNLSILLFIYQIFYISHILQAVKSTSILLFYSFQIINSVLTMYIILGGYRVVNITVSIYSVLAPHSFSSEVLNTSGKKSYLFLHFYGSYLKIQKELQSF